MHYEIAGLKVSMNPKYDPLLNQAIPYQIESTKDIVDCEIPQGNTVIDRYLIKHPELTPGEAEYLLYGVYFYDTLIEHMGIFLHASCVVYEGLAYLFSAPCGTGKSTHTAIWKKIFPSSYILNDDKPAIKSEDGIFYAYGTPFSGKTNQNTNIKIPIAGVAFIKRGLDNNIVKLSSKEALAYFWSQTLKPHIENRLDQMAIILDKIIKSIPMYEFTCNMEDNAALTSHRAMKPKFTKRV